MILTVPLYPGTLLANVRYKWIVSGVEGPELSIGVSQPSPTWPEFRFDVEPPIGAEEMIAYDATDSSNWNPAGYLGIPQQPVAIPTEVVTHFGGITRSVPFWSVYEAIVRRHGLDPDGDALRYDTARGVTEHINNRVRAGWRYWDWSETRVTEQRAFRPVWSSIVTYAVGAEVYFPDQDKYFRLAVLPPPTPPQPPPSNITYWHEITISDRFVPLDAPGVTSIDEMIEAYNSNPRVAPSSWPVTLPYMISEKGVDFVGHTTANTVWLNFKARPPRFTAHTYLDGVTYQPGQIVLWPEDGECYQAIAENLDTPPVTSSNWAKIQFPEFLAHYVKAGAYGDGLLESDPKGDSAAGQLRVAKASAAFEEAEIAIAREINSLIAQGEVHHYRPFRTPYRGTYTYPLAQTMP